MKITYKQPHFHHSENVSVVLEAEFKIPFICFNVLIEDRRPDLTEEDAKQLGYKYKTSIRAKIFNKELSVIVHSLTPGFIMIDGKEVNTQQVINPEQVK